MVPSSGSVDLPSGVSRIAATMLSVDTRHEENVTVRNVSPTPRQYEITIVRIVTCGVKVNPNDENISEAAVVNAKATATPAPTPTTAEARL